MQHMQKPIAYDTATVKQWSSSRCFLFGLWNAPRLIFRRRKVILRIDFSNIMILSHGCRLLCRWLNSFQLIPSGSYWVLWAKSSSFKAAHLSTNTCMWPVKVSENGHIDKANCWMSSVHTMSYTFRTCNWIFWPAFAHNDSSILNADHLVRVLEIFWKSSDCTHPRLFETVDLLHRTCLRETWFLGHQPCPQRKHCAYHHLSNSVRIACDGYWQYSLSYLHRATFSILFPCTPDIQSKKLKLGDLVILFGHSPLVYLWNVDLNQCCSTIQCKFFSVIQ